ncbi:MAG: hypothetical protein JSR82_16275 [Verrucomicrobia bacterium]|nr:hypothetical protein [Verrucomicrobiota bacterium]
MKPRVSMLAILLGVAVGLWFNFRPAPELPEPARPAATSPTLPPPSAPPARVESTPSPATVARALAGSPTPAVRPTPPASATAPVAAPTAAPAASVAAAPVTDDLANAVREDIEQAKVMLRDYRTLYGENPVGTNAEIMRALMGGNPKGATLGPFEGASLNGEGELLDRWGTPYFFHQLSKDRMEIISAGPDRKLFTPDDVK